MIKNELLIQAYRKVCNYADDIVITKEMTDFSSRMIEEYNMLNAIDEFENTRSDFIPAGRPINVCKQIALDAAVAAIGRQATQITFVKEGENDPLGSSLVEMAQTIYQWLTEPVTDKR